MLTTAGPARLTASANERCACGTSAAPASSACSPATALGPLQNVNRANSNTAAAARPTKVHLRRNFSDSCRVSTSGLYVRSRSSPLSRSGGASKGADRYVYNAQFLERIKLCTGASVEVHRESVLVHTNAREGRYGSSGRRVGSRRQVDERRIRTDRWRAATFPVSRHHGNGGCGAGRYRSPIPRILETERPRASARRARRTRHQQARGRWRRQGELARPSDLHRPAFAGNARDAH